VKISTREKRFLFSGGAVVLVVAILYLTPLLPSEDLSSTVKEKRTFLQKQRELLSQEESFKARLAQGQARLAQDMGRLLPVDNPSAAGPALQKILQDLADPNQVEISRKTPLPEQKLPENISKVSVQIDVSCSLEQLVRFLAAIENYDKFLKVDELNIMGIRQRNRDIINPQIKVSCLIETAPPAAKAADAK
jgi:type II secretory pathway component PulM